MEEAAAVVEAVADIEIVMAVVGGCLLAVAMMITVEATDVPMAAVAVIVVEEVAAAMIGTVAIAAQVDVEAAETTDVLAADAVVEVPPGLPRPSFAVFRVIPPILTSTTIVEQAYMLTTINMTV